MTSATRRASWAATSFASRMSATQAITLALVFASYAASGPVVAGAVLAARSLPSVVAPWLSGFWYDRRSPRSLLVIVGVLEVATVSLSPLLARSAVGVTVLALLLGTSIAVFDTTVTATVANTGVSALRASVLTGLAFDSAKVAAALLAWWMGRESVAAAAACVLLVALGVAGQVRSAPGTALGRDRGPVWGAWARPTVPALVIGVALNLTVGQMLFWQTSLAREDVNLFLVANVCVAVGAVLGNLVLARVGMGRGSMRAGVVVSAVGLLAASCLPGVTALAVGTLVWGLGIAWWYQILRGWVIASAPEGLRGRAGTLLGVTSRASLLVSAPLLGVVAGLVGVPSTAWLAFGTCIVVAVCVPMAPRWS